MNVKQAIINLGAEALKVELPDGTDILTMGVPQVLRRPQAAVAAALAHPIATPPLRTLLQERLEQKPAARAVVVISDGTRPVPYRGEAGILWPILQCLLDAGLPPERICVLVATGTHRPMREDELRESLDPRLFSSGISIENHDCRAEDLVRLGCTSRGSDIWINRRFMEADIRILTGLVESHFMAGVSGGRKAVCPGLIGEQSTYVFHGPEYLAAPEARDLVLKGNPCHEEAVEVARTAGVDFIVNVTLDHRFQPTGVFAGELEAAHERAVQELREFVTIPVDHRYDMVITHGGFVGINHYQAAKAGVTAATLVRSKGRIVIVADNSDTDPVGSSTYRTLLHLLKLHGPQAFLRLIRSPDWRFTAEQWQVQMWAKAMTQLSMDKWVYYSPQLQPRDYAVIPGRDGNSFLPVQRRYENRLQTAAHVVERSAKAFYTEWIDRWGLPPSVAFLADGPYGIPELNTQTGGL